MIWSTRKELADNAWASLREILAVAMKSSIQMHSEIMVKSFRHTGHQAGHVRKFSVHHFISRIDIVEPALERFAFWVLKEVDKKGKR